MFYHQNRYMEFAWDGKIHITEWLKIVNFGVKWIKGDRESSSSTSSSHVDTGNRSDETKNKH